MSNNLIDRGLRNLISVALVVKHPAFRLNSGCSICSLPWLYSCLQGFLFFCVGHIIMEASLSPGSLTLWQYLSYYNIKKMRVFKYSDAYVWQWLQELSNFCPYPNKCTFILRWSCVTFNPYQQLNSMDGKCLNIRLHWIIKHVIIYYNDNDVIGLLSMLTMDITAFSSYNCLGSSYKSVYYFLY